MRFDRIFLSHGRLLWLIVKLISKMYYDNRTATTATATSTPLVLILLLLYYYWLGRCLFVVYFALVVVE